MYGSLVPGGSYWARYCEGKVATQARARVLGRIYQTRDGYLALAFASGGTRWIGGWRLVLRDEAALMDIDRLEGYEAAHAPEQNEYERVRVECFADDEPVAPMGSAWVYIMTPAQLARAGAVEIFSMPPT